MWNPLRARRERREAYLLEREAFRAAKRLVREDVTLFGEQVAALELAPDATHDVREHHRFALEAYDRAKAALEPADSLAEVEAVEAVLEDGRWERAAVLALASGEPLPERRGPCFFNAQHGPSVAKVQWAPPHGTPRRIDVCRNDQLRLEGGEEPEARKVRVGDRWLPWYAAEEATSEAAMLRQWAGGSPLGRAARAELSTLIQGVSSISPSDGRPRH